MDGDLQRIENRAWRLEWRRFRRRAEQIHISRMMRPGLGYRWLYADFRR